MEFLSGGNLRHQPLPLPSLRWHRARRSAWNSLYWRAAERIRIGRSLSGWLEFAGEYFWHVSDRRVAIPIAGIASQESAAGYGGKRFSGTCTRQALRRQQ